MKHLKNNVSIAVLLAASLFWTGCQKEVSNMSPEIQTNQSTTARLGGVVNDNPNLVSLVPLIMSSGTGSLPVIALGKPVRGGGGTTDATPPAVSITSPTNGATVSGSVSVAVTATDNVGVASVSLSVDGTVKTTLTAAPYNFTWDASSVIDGTHTLAATAKDANGNSSSYTITVAKNTVIIILPPPALPSSYQLTTPPIADQGNEFTCVPFATTYAARSIEQYYRSGASSYSLSANIFSPEYVYNQTRITSDCSSGTSIGLTLDLMKNKGVATWQTMPYFDNNGCGLMPTAAQDAEAANYKIGGYSKIINTDQTAIKTMIAGKHPVMTSLLIDDNFMNAGTGFIWKTSGLGTAPHSLIICGYDDSKHAYRVMNSWGTSWGDAGYGWIDYDFFPTKAGYYVYVMNY